MANMAKESFDVVHLTGGICVPLVIEVSTEYGVYISSRAPVGNTMYEVLRYHYLISGGAPRLSQFPTGQDCVTSSRPFESSHLLRMVSGNYSYTRYLYFPSTIKCPSHFHLIYEQHSRLLIEGSAA